LDNKKFQQKIDPKGRIFYLDSNSSDKKFTHPKMVKIKKSRLERQNEISYGKLKEGWECLNYKDPKTGETKLLFIDHINKVTSWTDPRLKNVI